MAFGARADRPMYDCVLHGRSYHPTETVALKPQYTVIHGPVSGCTEQKSVAFSPDAYQPFPRT